jgi:hypothetical protein
MASKKRSYDFNILPKKWDQKFSFAPPFQFQIVYFEKDIPQYIVLSLL